MTGSAPMEPTNSTFGALQTPVTSAPNDLANCTANVPTPPAAPLIRTRCPGWIRPQSRRPCSAVNPARGAAAASSNETFAVLRSRQVDVLDLKSLRSAVTVTDNGLHEGGL